VLYSLLTEKVSCKALQSLKSEKGQKGVTTMSIHQRAPLFLLPWEHAQRAES